MAYKSIYYNAKQLSTENRKKNLGVPKHLHLKTNKKKLRMQIRFGFMPNPKLPTGNSTPKNIIGLR